MAHQEVAGQITVRRNGEVVMKIYAECGGENAGAVAEAIRDARAIPKTHEAYTLATVAGLGCDDCLLVQAKAFSAAPEDDKPPLRTSFGDAAACPYVGRDTAEYLELVDT